MALATKPEIILTLIDHQYAEVYTVTDHFTGDTHRSSLADDHYTITRDLQHTPRAHGPELLYDLKGSGVSYNLCKELILLEMQTRRQPPSATI
jgi:hypothetical protein